MHNLQKMWDKYGVEIFSNFYAIFSSAKSKKLAKMWDKNSVEIKLVMFLQKFNYVSTDDIVHKKGEIKMMENTNNNEVMNEVVAMNTENTEMASTGTTQDSSSKYTTYAKRAGLVVLGAVAAYAIYKGVRKVMEMKAAHDDAECVDVDVDSDDQD